MREGTKLIGKRQERCGQRRKREREKKRKKRRKTKKRKKKRKNVDFGSIRLSVIENVWSFVHPINF
jgi:hypothetical protein